MAGQHRLPRRPSVVQQARINRQRQNEDAARKALKSHVKVANGVMKAYGSSGGKS